MEEFIIYKIVCELRFHPSLSFYDERNKIANSLFKDYKHWSHDSNKIILSDYKKRSVLRIDHNRLILEQDIPESVKDFKSKFETAFKEYNKKVPISDFKRIGLRTQHFMPVEFNFSELVKLTHEKFLPQNEGILKIVGSDTQDYQYNINSKNKDFFINMFCGPIKKSEIPRWFTPTSLVHNEDQILKDIDYPEVAFFADLDCFTENPNNNELDKFLEKSFDFIPIFDKLMGKYIKD